MMRPVTEAIPVNPADIRVLSTHAVLDVLNEIGPKFERATGNRLSIGYDPANAVKRQIENGAAFDVAIVTRPVFDDLATQGKILPETRADSGRSGLGVAVRKGAPKPDIATTEAFKRALLAAKSVVRSTEGTSGIYFEKLLDRLGIAELVARGEADMAVQQIAELLPVTGAQYAGPFPPELQLYSEFAAGVASASKHREAAMAFIATLTTPSAVALFTAARLEPILR